MRYLLTAMVLLTTVSLVNYSLADRVYEEWFAIYDGPAGFYDRVLDLAVDSEGNIYVSGPSYGVSSASDYCTIKYDSEGNELWVARYDGPGNDRDTPYELVLDDDGYVYVTGQSTGIGSGWDICTIKYDSGGNELWVAEYDGPASDDDLATSITLDDNGNVYVAGYISTVETDYDFCVIKYDNDGNLIWMENYNGPSDKGDAIEDIVVDDYGNVYVTGFSYSGEMDWDADYCTIKYDSEGNEVWVARYDGPQNMFDRPFGGIAIDSQGNVCITGESDWQPYGPDYCTVKYDNDGNELWAVNYNGSGDSNDFPYGIAFDSQGCVYVTGQSYGETTGYDSCTIKYDTNGNELWVQRYDTPGGYYQDGTKEVVIDAFDNAYVTGFARYNQEGTGDILTIKYGEAGEEIWVVLYDGPQQLSDFGIEISIDAQGNVYVGGGTNSISPQENFVTIKYRQTGVGIELTYFNATPTQKDVAIKWSVETTEGEHILGFNLYRRELSAEQSSLGDIAHHGIKDDWIKINTTLITGQNPYTYTDSNVESGVAYEYKLEAIIADEGAETLGTAQATAGQPASFAILALYPNPASDYLTCLLAMPEVGLVEIALYDISGRLVLKQQLEVTEPTELEVPVDVSGLASGVYTLQASMGNVEVSPACGGVAVVVR